MRKILLLIGLLFSFAGFAQQTDTDAVVKAFKTANADEVARYFDDYIDLKFLDKDEVKNMGRNQATIALKNFFEENNEVDENIEIPTYLRNQQDIETPTFLRNQVN